MLQQVPICSFFVRKRDLFIRSKHLLVRRLSMWIASTLVVICSSVYGNEVDVPRLLDQTYLDEPIKAFPEFVFEALMFAESRGYHFSTDQWTLILAQSKTVHSSSAMRKRLENRLAMHRQGLSIEWAYDWYQQPAGRRIVMGLAAASRPERLKKQRTSLSQSLLANDALSDFAEDYENRFKPTEKQLRRRQAVMGDLTSGIAKILLPNRPFQSQEVNEVLALQSFELRPQWRRQEKLRWIDGLRSLYPSEVDKFRVALNHPQMTTFIQLVDTTTSEVMNEAVQELLQIIAGVVDQSKQDASQEPVLPEALPEM
ncbi:hypothetical protein [Marinibactrum halimedae]|uniref:Uncharacterized protein n=1 Tax=Marinibactrum halimedae TaxID=1444977 RepID=A0AA37WMN1_9GAMM|nr:hypothetical protein [Marinibactrum halimedae]MCD9460067.1 hypothetical protein [Marinibactrum halimedae]GLS26465.1 hypothetical protein GCM10007877_21810 [Marinibactrum halimedae]